MLRGGLATIALVAPSGDPVPDQGGEVEARRREVGASSDRAGLLREPFVLELSAGPAAICAGAGPFIRGRAESFNVWVPPEAAPLGNEDAAGVFRPDEVPGVRSSCASKKVGIKKPK